MPELNLPLRFYEAVEVIFFDFFFTIFKFIQLNNDSYLKFEKCSRLCLLSFLKKVLRE